jgi:hypothetical protein
MPELPRELCDTWAWIKWDYGGRPQRSTVGARRGLGGGCSPGGSMQRLGLHGAACWPCTLHAARPAAAPACGHAATRRRAPAVAFSPTPGPGQCGVRRGGGGDGAPAAGRQVGAAAVQGGRVGKKGAQKRGSLRAQRVAHAAATLTPLLRPSRGPRPLEELEKVAHGDLLYANYKIDVRERATGFLAWTCPGAAWEGERHGQVGAAQPVLMRVRSPPRQVVDKLLDSRSRAAERAPVPSRDTAEVPGVGCLAGQQLSRAAVLSGLPPRPAPVHSSLLGMTAQPKLAP